MRSKFTILAILVCLALMPVLPYFANVAFGYGGGGAGVMAPPTPVVTLPNPVVTVTPPAVIAPSETALEKLTSEATKLFSGEVDVADLVAEKLYKATVVDKIIATGTPAAVVSAVTNFVTYGTTSTMTLGAGERGGVVNSFKTAFGKLPTTVTDWNDVVKIANGRWPEQTSTTTEATAKVTFKKIYNRVAVMTNTNDNAAVTVMAYGLRPTGRNMASERAAINSFRAIMKKSPVSAADWDAIRAIAYSGAKR